MIESIVKTKWGDGSQAKSVQQQIIKKSEQLFILNGIPESMKFDDLYQYFEQFGTIKSLDPPNGTLLLDEWEENFLKKSHQVRGMF